MQLFTKNIHVPTTSSNYLLITYMCQQYCRCYCKGWLEAINADPINCYIRSWCTTAHLQTTSQRSRSPNITPASAQPCVPKQLLAYTNVHTTGQCTTAHLTTNWPQLTYQTRWIAMQLCILIICNYLRAVLSTILLNYEY